MTDTTLKLAVDTTGVVSAATALDKMATAGTAAEVATTKLEAASKSNAGAAQTVAQATQRVSAATAGVAVAAKTAGQAQDVLAKSAKQIAMQHQIAAVQVKDFIEQMISGANPVRAFAQQGATLVSVYGGFGATLSALGSLISPVVVAMAAAAAVVGGTAFAFSAGSSEARELSKSLLLTNSAAGITAGQFEKLKGSIASATGTTVGSARDSLQQLVSTGRFAGDALVSAATAAQLLSKATGQSTDEIVKQFVSLSGNVASGAEQLNKTYHFLSAAQLDQIKKLEDQGNGQRAVKLTLDALSEGVKGAAREVGALGSYWDRAKAAVSGYLDAAKDIGKSDTLSVALAREQTKLDELQARLRIKETNRRPGEDVPGNLREQVTAQQALVDRLKESSTLSEKTAKDTAASNEREQARTLALKLGEQYLSKQLQLKKELDDANAIFDKAGAAPNDPNRLQTLAGIRDKFNPGTDQASLAARVDSIKTALASELDAYKNAGTEIDALRAAGRTSDEGYYGDKRKLIESEAAAAVKALKEENAALASSRTRDPAEAIRNREQIAKNNAAIKDTEADASSKLAVNYIQQKAAQDALEASYKSLSVAASQYIDTLKLQQDREVSGMGVGTEERARRAEIDKANDRADAQRRALAQEREARTNQRGSSLSDAEEKDLSRRLQLINDSNAEEIAALDKGNAEKLSKQGQFATGAHEALANYLSTSKNVAEQVNEAFTRSFQSIEDALVTFVQTGKLDFKGLANSIIADFVRIQVKAAITSIDLQGIFSKLSGLISGGGYSANDGVGYSNAAGISGGRATGGTVSKGSIYQVNENSGPGELLNVGDKQYLMAGMDGSVSPKGSASGGGSWNQTVHVNIDARTDQAQVQQLVASGVQQGNKAFAAQLHAMGVL